MPCPKCDTYWVVQYTCDVTWWKTRDAYSIQPYSTHQLHPWDSTRRCQQSVDWHDFLICIDPVRCPFSGAKTPAQLSEKNSTANVPKNNCPISTGIHSHVLSEQFGHLSHLDLLVGHQPRRPNLPVLPLGLAWDVGIPGSSPLLWLGELGWPQNKLVLYIDETLPHL